MHNCQRSVIRCLQNYPFLDMTKMCSFGFWKPDSLRYSCPFHKSERLHNIANHPSENRVLNMENLRFYFSKLTHHETKSEVLYPETSHRYSHGHNWAGSHDFLRMAADPISWSSLNFEASRARRRCLAQNWYFAFPKNNDIFPVKQKDMLKYLQCLPINSISYLEKDSAAVERVAQKSCGCPTPGIVQGQRGWGSEHLGFLESLSSYGSGVGIGWSLTTLPIQTILWISLLKHWNLPTHLLFRT